MHTLFALEDIYGLKIDKLDDEVCIRLDKNRGTWNNAFVEGVRIIMLRDKASVFRNIYRGEGVQPVLQRYINIVD